METESLISAIEKYLREFIAYLLAFFSPEEQKEAQNADPDGVNRSVVFAVLSAVIGAYLWNRYIASATGHVADMTGTLVDSLMRWLSYGLLLYGILRMLRFHPPVVATVLGVVRVFAVAHVLAIYLAYVTMNAIWIASSPNCYSQLSRGWSATLAFFFELVLIWIYLPREVKSLFPLDTVRWRRRTANGIYLCLISLIVLTPLAVWKIETAGQPGTCLCRYYPALQGCAK